MKTIIANWKMNLGVRGSVALARQTLLALRGQKMAPDVVIAPGFLALSDVRKVVARSRVSLCAQDVFWEDQGAFTGEVSTNELIEVGVTHVILGHSERRHFLNEDDQMISNKTAHVLAKGLVPIVCIGETENQYEAGQTLDVLSGQISAVLDKIPNNITGRIFVAYEPVWAIGTGKTPSAGDIVAIHAEIRNKIRTALPDIAVDVLYGGSVDSENAYEFLKEEEIDGLLVGGASLKIRELQEIFSLSARVLAA